jgi:hypothetical protein
MAISTIFFAIYSRVEPMQGRELVSVSQISALEEKHMKRVVVIGLALLVSLAMSASASARLGFAPLAAQNDAVIQVRGGHGHGHRGGRGHHYGWGRGRGHHYGWRHHRRFY